jgi:hypothetical protein
MHVPEYDDIINDAVSRLSSVADDFTEIGLFFVAICNEATGSGNTGVATA